MHRTLALIVLTASSLSVLAGTTIAQQPAESPRHAVQLAERVTLMKASLSNAITAAEAHSKGVAIGVRTSMHSSIFQHHPSVSRSNNGSTWTTTVPAADRPNENQTGNDPAARGADRARYGEDTLYAVVTCVVDRARVRDIVIDMRDNTVVGVQSTSGFRDDSSMSEDRQWGEDRQWNDANTQQRASLTRASDLMNASARNASGTTVGDIDDLAIDPDTNRIVYGVLRRGGFFGMGESRYAIATSELAMSENGEVMIDLNDSDFENHAGFDNNNWPTKADPEWNTNWTSEPVNAPASKRIVKASEIIGSDVKCRDGKDLGEITDLVVDPRTGRVVYAIVDSDRGDLPVPMGAIRRDGDNFTIQMTSTELQSKPILDSGREPNWSDARWNRRLHDSYGTPMDLSPASSDRSGR
jgi:sporulation protein YlmC with PRC-barrel domain